MRESYNDIRARIQEPPRWWDENGVPRYDDFTPRLCADIYADECVLLRVECQNCGHEFDVCCSWGTFDRIRDVPPLADQIDKHAIHYGDPPNIDCCPSGPTMNSIPRRVLQLWRREGLREWVRDATFERDISCDWAED